MVDATHVPVSLDSRPVSSHIPFKTDLNAEDGVNYTVPKLEIESEARFALLGFLLAQHGPALRSTAPRSPLLSCTPINALRGAGVNFDRIRGVIRGKRLHSNGTLQATAFGKFGTTAGLGTVCVDGMQPVESQA